MLMLMMLMLLMLLMLSCVDVAGSTPYPGMGAREVMRKVRDGYRLERPGHCHPDLYHIIQKCWAGDMNKRPDFSELRKVSPRLGDQEINPSVAWWRWIPL